MYINAYTYQSIHISIQMFCFLQQILFMAFIVVHCKMIKKFKFKLRIKIPFHFVVLLLLWILDYSCSHKSWTDIGSKAFCLIIMLFCSLYLIFLCSQGINLQQIHLALLFIPTLSFLPLTFLALVFGYHKTFTSKVLTFDFPKYYINLNILNVLFWLDQ